VSSAIAGLVGAAIGALAGVAGAFLSQRMQARATQERALQSKREEAYSSTLRYLLRVQNRRSGIAAESGHTYIVKESIKDFFDDMVEAQFWASTLTVYCAEKPERSNRKSLSRPK
jgi:gas vesicle protein